MQVKIVYLFGSEVERRASFSSDIDIGIVFGEVLEDTLNIYNQLYQAFAKIVLAREVDIVFLDKATLPLRFEAVTKGKVFYTQSVQFEANYREKTIKEYIDFKPLLEESERCILEAMR